MLARNVLVVETAKILWRRHRYDLMLVRSADYRQRWPRLAAAGGPSHALEAPWLLGDIGPWREATGANAAHDKGQQGPLVRASSIWHARAARVRLLHAAAYAVRAGDDDRSAALAVTLYERRSTRRGPYESPVTSIREDASLVDTMLRVGLHDEAASLTTDLLARIGQFHDPALSDGLILRAQLLGLRVPAGGCRPPGIAAEQLNGQLERLHARLDGQG
jgi:hypothetical protein